MLTELKRRMNELRTSTRDRKCKKELIRTEEYNNGNEKYNRGNQQQIRGFRRMDQQSGTEWKSPSWSSKKKKSKDSLKDV